MLKPLRDMVLVQPDEELEKSAGGVYLPDVGGKEKKPRPYRGLVLAVGPGVLEKRIEVGSRVIFSKYGGTEVLDDGTELRLVKECEVVALE